MEFDTEDQVLSELDWKEGKFTIPEEPGLLHGLLGKIESSKSNDRINMDSSSFLGELFKGFKLKLCLMLVSIRNILIAGCLKKPILSL